ncbi:unnamed protein product [Adineta ricciae]|uniref:Uncharacterized protein n=1 Tax=Adineta ricciae TaxID=249248 RepID=A0A815HC96_ADIRI|nr:unnamed protein product [Adineta ricciae]CAF1352642.1 unnamed protein product [Adineta ricciae]
MLYLIPFYHTLRCYSCRGEKRCELLLSSTTVKLVYGDDFYDSCSITRNVNGSIIRDIVPSYRCQSSPSQFCCNQDLCNSLSSPPLPALTKLTCTISICPPHSSTCNQTIVYRGSATQSCVTRYGKFTYKSYQTGCLSNATTSLNASCCYSPGCNNQILTRNEARYCYTCDSRITGLKGCDILNTSSPFVYNSISSDPSESCAMIIGLSGKDFVTGQNYPAFTIRTFISNCTNQSSGDVTYGGIRFQGRIDCCSTALCNTDPLYINITIPLNITRATNRILKVTIFITIFILGIGFVIIGMAISIYRFILKNSLHRYLPIVRSG